MGNVVAFSKVYDFNNVICPSPTDCGYWSGGFTVKKKTDIDTLIVEQDIIGRKFVVKVTDNSAFNVGSRFTMCLGCDRDEKVFHLYWCKLKE